MASVRSPSPSGSVLGKRVIKPPTTTNQGNMIQPNVDSVGPKVRVEPFTGKRVDLRPYLIQLRMTYDLNPRQFPDDKSKVIFAASNLKDAAFGWFEPYLTDHYENGPGARDKTKRLIKTFSEFESELKMVFGTFNKERTAA